MKLTFTEEGDFQSVNAAERWLKDRGFSVASMQAGAPRGILFGDIPISKWRNLSRGQRASLDGVMQGDRRGPVTIEIFEHACRAAKTAAGFSTAEVGR